MNKVKLVGNVVPLKKGDPEGSVQERIGKNQDVFYSITFKVITEEKNPNWILCSMTSSKNKFPFILGRNYYLEGHIRSWSKDDKVGQSIQIDQYREVTKEEEKRMEMMIEQEMSGSSSQ